MAKKTSLTLFFTTVLLGGVLVPAKIPPPYFGQDERIDPVTQVQHSIDGQLGNIEDPHPDQYLQKVKFATKITFLTFYLRIV